jgi:creatinine amidohydrolase
MGDYLSAEGVAVKIAERTTANGLRCLVAPTLPFGGADYFGSMPGGIALGQATLRAVLGDMFACLLRHGFTRLIVINGHGGNVQAIHEVTQDIYRARKLLIPSFYLWRVGYGMLPGVLGDEVAKKAAGHGADPLTASKGRRSRCRWNWMRRRRTGYGPAIQDCARPRPAPGWWNS